MHSDQFSPSCYLFLYCLMKHPWLICQVCDGTSWLPSTTLMVERDLKFSTTLSASDLWRHPEKNSVRYFVLSWWRMESLWGCSKKTFAAAGGWITTTWSGIQSRASAFDVSITFEARAVSDFRANKPEHSTADVKMWIASINWRTVSNLILLSQSSNLCA